MPANRKRTRSFAASSVPSLTSPALSRFEGCLSAIFPNRLRPNSQSASSSCSPPRLAAHGVAGAESVKDKQAASTLRHAVATKKHDYANMYYGANLYIAGWAHLRAGNLEKAIQRLEESSSEENHWFGRGIGYPLLAIAYHELGRSEDALRSFEQSQILLERWLDESVRQSKGSPSIPWVDWIEFLINHRQASMVVKGHTPAIDPQLRQLARFADAAIE